MILCKPYSFYKQLLTALKPLAVLALLCISTLSLADTPFTPCEHRLSAPLQVLSSGWSRELNQQRDYSYDQTGLSADELASLEPAWSFAFKGTNQPRSLPAITDQAIFLGSQEGAVFALDPQTGCGFWRYQADDQVRTAVSVGKVNDKGKDRWLVFFGDNTASAYAVDAISGELVWKRQLDDLLMSVMTGSPVLFENNLYVPISSWSVGLAVNPWGGCCKFRGSVSSLNALTGELNWQSYTIEEEAKPTGRNWLGGQRYGPSGAGVWSSPTIDEKRRRLYVGTGQSYTSPVAKTSDSILAFDIDTGKMLWAKQALPEDAWNVACIMSAFSYNCPDESNLDYDFGAPPILVTDINGRDVILAGAKSGMAYALDPENNGNFLWQASLGRGGFLGGIHWGMVADAEYLYAPVADTDASILENMEIPGEQKPGLNKVNIRTGELIWHSSTKHVCDNKEEGCRNGLSAAATGIPGAILAPGMDGVLRAYDKESGAVIWQFDSTVPVTGINGVEGEGGTLDAGGVVVANGMVFFNSGYGGLISSGSTGGNVFWVLKKKNAN